MTEEISRTPGPARRVAVLGGLGVRPMIRLSLAGRRLLAYLAVKTRPVSRCIAAQELWPDTLDETARANLRRALWHVPRGWISCVSDDLILNATCDVIDAHNAAEKALRGETLTLDDMRILREDLLPGWHEEWVLDAREAFRLLRVQALETACRTMAAKGAHALATQAGAAALAAEPLRESAAEALIEAHLAQGNRFEAIQCFHNLTVRLHSELGVEPATELKDRLALVSAGAGDR
jgi:DNA-binding SARP family transcriptional activator